MSTYKTLVVVFSIFVAGCAVAPYKMSDNAIAIRSKMSHDESLAIVHKQLYPSNRQTGLCAVSPRVGDTLTPGTSASKLSSTKGSTITYTGVGVKALNSSISGSVLGGTGKITTNYEYYDALFTMDLTKLGYIGVEENIGFKPRDKKRAATRFNDQGKSQLSVQPCPAGQMVLLYAGGLQFGQGSLSVWVHVAPDNLDSLLAALNYLSPSATMRLGTDTLAY